MIRTSTRVAVAALALSLVLHILGVGLTARPPSDPPPEDAPGNEVELGDSFEDIAEAAEPSAPDPAEEPEPPVAETPEPELTEPPTSQPRIASTDPLQTRSPGSGMARQPQPDPVVPTRPTAGQAAAPEATEAPQPGAEFAPPVVPSPGAEAAEGAEAAGGAPEDAREAARAAEAPAEATAPGPAEEVIAALPVETAPALPVTPPADPAGVPVPPAETEAAPVAPDAPVVPVPETETAETETGGSELAVETSPRPRAPSQRPTESDTETAAAQPGAGPPPIRFTESPLVAYARTGDLRAWRGPSGFGGPGNARETNYAGQVFLHLKRAGRIRYSGRGVANFIMVINRDGSLAAVDVVVSNGSFAFNNAVKDLVRSAAPFPVPPAGAERRFRFNYTAN